MEKPIPFIASLAATAIISGTIAYTLGHRSAATAQTDHQRTEAEFVESEDSTPQADTQENLRQNLEETPETAQPEPHWSRVNSESRTLGYEAAGADLAAALETAKSLQDPQRSQYVQGLFARVAETLAPAEALTIATSLETDLKNQALRTLAFEWIKSSSALSDEQLRNLQNRARNLNRSYLGLEVDLASMLSRAGVDSTIKQAWAKSFENHLGRSELQARLFSGGTPQEIEAAFAASQDWTSWERNRFAESLLKNWSRKDAGEAWQWYSENRDALQTDQTEKIISDWAFQKPDNLIQNLDTFQSSQERQYAIAAISRSLARQGTQQALDWAESLEEVEEQNMAYEAVYNATPKGIGAMVRVQDGFPQINEIIPGGALENSNIQAGDLLVEAQEEGKEPLDLYGRNLRETINKLRGQPGSSVDIKVLRQNPETGRIEEHSATIVRDLLILGQEDD
ncbi:MAG: hypothetical protein AAGB46_03780 [Verrucomicrobiota bacterium]